MLLINSDLGLFSPRKHQRKVQLAYSVDIKRLFEWLLVLTPFCAFAVVWSCSYNYYRDMHYVRKYFIYVTAKD